MQILKFKSIILEISSIFCLLFLILGTYTIGTNLTPGIVSIKGKDQVLGVSSSVSFLQIEDLISADHPIIQNTDLITGTDEQQIYTITFKSLEQKQYEFPILKISNTTMQPLAYRIKSRLIGDPQNYKLKLRVDNQTYNLKTTDINNIGAEIRLGELKSQEINLILEVDQPIFFQTSIELEILGN